MEILINELSLDGQFADENEFFNNFDTVLETIKFIDLLEFSLLKEYSFFQSKITSELKLNDFLKLRIDRARRMKQFLLKLAYNPPYWNDNQKHFIDNNYSFNGNKIFNTSLAESCERDRIVLSFNHKDFLQISLEIQRDNSPITLYNLIDKKHFLDYLLSNTKIKPLKYCKFKFENSNLDFSKIEDGYGFDSLDNKEQEESFLLAFNGFSKMSWEDIIKSDGLEYKQYSKPKKQCWFLKNKGLYANTDIYKFRVTQKYRCFGYRKDNKFFVLRFEIDHKISDNG